MKYFFFVLLLANVLLLLWEINTGVLHQELEAVSPAQKSKGIGQIRLLSEITRDEPRNESIAITDQTIGQGNLPFVVQKDSQDVSSAGQPASMSGMEGKLPDSAVLDLPREIDESGQGNEPSSIKTSQPLIPELDQVEPLAERSDSIERAFQSSDDSRTVASGSATVRDELSTLPAAIEPVPEKRQVPEIPNTAQSREEAVLDKDLADDKDGVSEKTLHGKGRQQAGASGGTAEEADPAGDQSKSSPGHVGIQHTEKPEKIQIMPEIISASPSRHAAVGAADETGNPPTVVRSCYKIGPFPDAEMMQAGTAAFSTAAGSVEIVSNKRKIPSGYVVLYPASETFEQSLDNYRMLKKQGYSDLWLFRKTAWRGAVSMGIYRNENRARRIAQRLLDKGMHVQVKPIYKNAPQYFLRVTAVNSGLQALQKALADLKRQISDLQLKETEVVSCGDSR